MFLHQLSITTQGNKISRHHLQDMATPKCKYGVFFPEHNGYLYVRKLAPGNEGGVALVRSITDRLQFVRKSTHPQDHKDPESKIAEVQFHRPHPLIPSLIWSQDHKVLNIYHKDHDTLKSTVMIQKYCNGGTLFQYIWYCIRHAKKAPEVLVWRMLDQRLQAFLDLINGQPGVTSLDCHLKNVFLHYEDGAKLPDFYTGDLGHAQPVDPIIWEETSAEVSKASPAEFRKIRKLDLSVSSGIDPSVRKSYLDTTGNISHDFSQIWWALVALMFRQDPEEFDPYDEEIRAESRELQEWSPELFECERKLQKIAFFAGVEEYTRYNDLEELKIKISRMAQLTAQADPEADVTSALADLDTVSYEDEDEEFPVDVALLEQYRSAHSGSGRPLVFDSRVPLLQLAKRWPEPWRVARIEESTDRVLGVEKMTYSFTLPKLRKTKHKEDPRTQDLAQPESLKIGLNQILTAAAVAETMTHKVQEDFSLLTFLRGEGEDPNEDDIFGLDPEWTGKLLAGPSWTSPAQSPKSKSPLKRPPTEDENESEPQPKRQLLINDFSPSSGAG